MVKKQNLSGNSEYMKILRKKVMEFKNVFTPYQKVNKVYLESFVRNNNILSLSRLISELNNLKNEKGDLRVDRGMVLYDVNLKVSDDFAFDFIISRMTVDQKKKVESSTKREFNKRKKDKAKELRRQQYLKLKEEFGDEN